MTPLESEEELTRKERREQARAKRRALEEAHAAGATRRRRLQLLGGVGAVVVIAIVLVLVLTSGGGGNPPPAPGSKEAKKIPAELASLVGGIPQTGGTLGKPTAPITLQYFGDLECPICQQFTLGALPFVINKWVRSGDLRIEYHSLSTATGNAEKDGSEPEGIFKKQQEAALAAGAQNKGWYYIETFYHEQGAEDSGYVTESYLDKIAKQVPGLNLAQWQKERANPKFVTELEEDAQTANSEGFEGTPSFLISRSGGATKKLEYSSLTEPTQFNEAIEGLLKS